MPYRAHALAEAMNTNTLSVMVGKGHKASVESLEGKSSEWRADNSDIRVAESSPFPVSPRKALSFR